MESIVYYQAYEMRISSVSVITLHTQYYCENGGETLLIQLIYLLFFGLIGVTIIAVALIITFVIFWENKKAPHYALPSYVVFTINRW